MIELNGMERVQLKKKIFLRYFQNLKKNKKIKILKMNNYETPWSVDIYAKNTKKLKKKLEGKNILTRYVYPPLNSQRIYKQIKGLPVSNDYCKNGLWLPSSLDIKMTQIDKISSMINKFYK